MDASWAMLDPGAGDPLLAWAVKDLHEKLCRISGRPFRLIAPGASVPEETPLLRLERLDPPEKALGPEGFRIRVASNGVWIQGNTPRAVVFGVMELLERLGCRWFAPGAYLVPEGRLLRLAEGTTRSVPAFPVRRISSLSASDPEWCLRNRLNAGYGFPPGRGGKSLYFGDGCHAFSRLVPPELFSTQPELFSEVAGLRVADGQPCLSNPVVEELVKKGVAEAFRRHPHAAAVHASQNDNLWWCECPRCRALADRYGGQSGLLIHFLNPLAREAALKFPGRHIATLAYTYTQAPPRGVTVDPGLVIRFCNYRPHCQIHPLESCPRNRQSYANLLGWAERVEHLHVYDYLVNGRQVPAPCPNLDAVAANLRLYRDLGVEGVFFSGPVTAGAWMEPLKSYLVARWLWDPARAREPMEEAFLRGYYGPHAGIVAQVLQRTRRAAAEAGIHPDLYGYGSGRTWGGACLEDLDRMLSAALAAGPRTGPYGERLLPLELTSAFLHAVSPTRRAEDVEALRVLAERLEVTRLGSGFSTADFIASLRATLPGGDLRLAAGQGGPVCRVVPGLGGLVTGIRLGAGTFLGGPTEEPIRPEGLRWILDPSDPWRAVSMRVVGKGGSRVRLARTVGEGPDPCLAEVRVRLLRDPPALKFVLRLENPGDRPRKVPLTLAITANRVPEVLLDGRPRTVRFDYPLKDAVIRPGPGESVGLRWPDRGLSIRFVSQVPPRTLLLPSRPWEGRRLLEVRYGHIALAPGAVAECAFWLFLGP